ncbi:Uroporphyrinogen-III methyltransferase / Uroporphyrinogen-III synthase [hydrothermal vent metagenome]|uniref:uroporphyrinogen-III C-methyltransferase n=1 Tax=hydrothermal vent metagenome TaxID=652676 RepID=A0A3B1D931_9ZZZZ
MTDSSARQGRVILVGAGPGDEGLLTLRGKEWLERADVIVYDHLVNWNMMRFAHANAETIYAGKKAGHASFEQEKINEILIDNARQGKTVVRLKGGDPFIFGRGGEEAIALKNAGIPIFVVPGVTSPVGVAAYAGIPLTHRDISSTVSIITGSNEKNRGDMHIDWEKIASRSGTLVFLMGARKLPLICDKLIRFGKDPDTPIAVIQWGTTARQKTWTGTLKTIVDIAMKENIAPPALTIIGEVVAMKPLIEWYEALPLFGKTVVITRAENQGDSMIQQLQEKGAEPVSFPVIQTVPPDDWSPLDRALACLSEYHGLIFTSVDGVKFFMRRLKETAQDIRELKGVRIYTIGPKTEKAVRDFGMQVDCVPENFVAESLIESLGRENVQGKRFLIPRALVAREILPDQLRAMGAEVDVVPAYQTVPPTRKNEVLAQRLQEGTVDVITFTSSSTVTNFLEQTGAELRPHLEGITFACIGPITADTAKKNGLKVAIIPKEFTVDALVTAIENHYADK